MGINQNDRLLIISNNVLSNTRNNGKTIYSYIDSLDPSHVAQLYFNGEYPSISGYKYFQITDKDIIKGLTSSQKRGRVINDVNPGSPNVIPAPPKHRGDLFRTFREILWKNKWRSKKLFDWIDEFSPTAVFFVGGNCVFAYDICEYIVKKYNTRLSLYITDDYIMPRKKESLLGRIRRSKIKKSINKCLLSADSFFTVSEVMRKEYKNVFGRDSSVIVNLTESLKLDTASSPNDVFSLIYAGSLYYGRDEVLGRIGAVIKEYNLDHEKKALLKVYSNAKPDAETKKRFTVDGACEYRGSLTKEELKNELNRSDILVFAESFDPEQIEKTRYSLSTKVPEYLSVGKPIFAVGPAVVGSMDYLSDVAMCVNDMSKLADSLHRLLNSEVLRSRIASDSEKKYIDNHLKENLQSKFLSDVFGY